MLMGLLKNETEALEAARRQLTDSERALTQARDHFVETTETCLVQPITIAGIFVGGFASDPIGGAGDEHAKSGFLSGINLSALTQILNATF